MSLFRLHPVKPMNATANKPPAKALNATTKILDSNNETNLKVLRYIIFFKTDECFSASVKMCVLITLHR